MRRERRVLRDNIFARRFHEAISKGKIDPSLRYLLESEAALLEKIAKKFEDVDHALAGRWHMIPPIVVAPAKGPLSLTLGDGGRLQAANIDGHHRFFIAQVLSQPTIDAMIREPVQADRTQISTHYTL